MNAKIIGWLWLLVIVTGISAFFVRSTLIVSGDAVTTASNIAQSWLMFRLAFAADVVSFSSYAVLTVLLFQLLKSVSETISLIAMVFGLAGSVVGVLILAFLLVPSLLLGGASYLVVFDSGQLEALSLTALRLHGHAYDLTFVFFGVQCALVGYLIAISLLCPRLLGVLLGAGGVCYVISAFVSFIAPQMGARLSLYVMPVALIGEGSLCLWLIFKGARSQ